MTILHRKEHGPPPDAGFGEDAIAQRGPRDDTVDAFIEDLRQFVLYRSLAATLAGEGLDESPQSSLSLEAADLRTWDGWSPQGWQFLDSLCPGEPLDQALAPYKTLVVSFCAWLSKWQAAMHRGALEELADLQRGFRATDPTAVAERGAAVPSPSRASGAEGAAMIPESWLRPDRFVRAS